MPSISANATEILGDQSTTKVSNKVVQQKFQQLEAMMKNQEKVNEELAKQKRLNQIKAEQEALKAA